MLFNSLFFIFAFLPVALVVYYAAIRFSLHSLALIWLIAVSLCFYAWWRPSYTLILLTSMTVNYAIGTAIGHWRGRGGLFLALGVGFNVGLLGYYKYAGLFADTLAALNLITLDLGEILLPLAISFFTFQQIAWLADRYNGLATNSGVLDYVLFVTFFPQLISGPIVHHGEMMGQFHRLQPVLVHRYLAVGFTLFVFGLFKKTVFADGIGAHAAPVFVADPSALHLNAADVLGGAMGYSLQIYFDFSGYSDMAVGLAYMFGIRLPINFYSPYKSRNISDFWRRWHMTLSRFLRDYLYIPLGGNRHGDIRRYGGLMITMVLGGLWHGAGWSFVLWGAIHGCLLMLHHAFRRLVRRKTERAATTDEGLKSRWRSKIARAFAIAMTFAAVTLAWIPFRAPDFDTSLALYTALLNLPTQASVGPFASYTGTLMLIGLLCIVWFAPNSNDWLGQFDPALKPDLIDRRQTLFIGWSPNLVWCVITVLLLWMAVLRMMTSGYVEFLYRFF